MELRPFLTVKREEKGVPASQHVGKRGEGWHGVQHCSAGGSACSSTFASGMGTSHPRAYGHLCTSVSPSLHPWGHSSLCQGWFPRGGRMPCPLIPRRLVPALWPARCRWTRECGVIQRILSPLAGGWEQPPVPGTPGGSRVRVWPPPRIVSAARAAVPGGGHAGEAGAAEEQ